MGSKDQLLSSLAGAISMSSRIMLVSFIVLCPSQMVLAADPSWQGKTILLTRPGVKLQAPEGQKIAPKTAGVARDLMFGVLKDEDGRLQISSRRQQGWIARGDAVPFDQAVAFFTKKLTADPKD